ncbi:MAG: DUF6398 domain-containing protein [Hydrogenophaga sp.]|nr:DUF6398 domain-containing protein [Hydrogenophaga sp.]
MTTPSTRVPAAMQAKFDAIAQLTDGFCAQHLNGEYRDLARLVLAALSRKRPSPLLKSREPTWAAAVLHALGTVNFLFDSTQTPHCKAADLFDHFGISSSNGSSKSKEVREALGMHPMSSDWTLPSRMEQNPLLWMLEVNGFMVDVRRMPLEVQQIAFDKGFIPYVPALKEKS